MAAANGPEFNDRRSHWPISLSVGGIVTTIALVVTLQENLATVDELDELREQHILDRQAFDRRFHALDSEGTRGLDTLGAEIRSELAALRQRVDDRTEDRFRGGDWHREDRRLEAEIARLEERDEELRAEIDRLRGFVVDLNRRLGGREP